MEIRKNNLHRSKISRVLTHHIHIDHKSIWVNYFTSLLEVESVDVKDKYLLTLFQDNKEVVIHQLYLLNNLTLLCIEYHPR